MILEELGKWGCDVPGALERLVDDEELYISCLHMFAEDEGFAALHASLEAGTYDAAFDHAHTLKGVAANLGLTPVFAPISVLVEALRAHEYGNWPALEQNVQDAFTHYKTLLQK